MEHAGPVLQPEVTPVVATGGRQESVTSIDVPRPRAPMTAKGMIGLQRMAGNGAVSAMVRRQQMVQRDGPPKASMPGPTSSQPPDAEVMFFEGYELRFDGEVLYRILVQMAERKGVDAPSEFAGRFENAPPTILKGSERAGLRDDIRKGLRDTNQRLDHEREEFCTKFEGVAIEAAKGILDKSKETIEKELSRLGITGDMVPLETGGSFPNFKMANNGAAGAMRRAAGELVPAVKEMDRTGRESAEASRKLGESQNADPFNLTNKGLATDDEVKRKAWMAATEAYEKIRRVKVAEAPAIAMYAEEPDAATKLTALSVMPDDKFADDVGEKAKRKLEHIEQVRPEIGKKFGVWQQAHLRRVTLDQMQATPFQREAVERKARKAAAAGDDKMVFALIAIGLGLLSAIPTGGAGLMAGISIAAGLAGAGLALYQLGEKTSLYSLATAANATDFDKAQAISDKDPGLQQLALDCVLALGDVFAAAAAFKALSVFAKAAKAGDVTAALKIAATAESVGVRGAPKARIVGEAVSGLSGEAIEQVGKSVGKSGGIAAQTHTMQAMAKGSAAGSKFGAELEAALDLMEHVQGRIPETAREMVQSGKVRPLTEEALKDYYGAKLGAEYWQGADSAGGFFDQGKDIIFIRGGRSTEDITGTLIHEATHRVGGANKARLDDFMSEAVAEFAERDFYMTLYAEGGPLHGTAPKSERIQQFLQWSDEQLMHNLEVRNVAARGKMTAADRARYMNTSGATAYEIVTQVFVDITADYRLRFPKAGR